MARGRGNSNVDSYGGAPVDRNDRVGGAGLRDRDRRVEQEQS